MTWAHYVQGGQCYVDSRNGFLVGPWAECIQAAVHFEHNVDFSRLPEYAGGEGPAGQVLVALEQWLGGRQDRQVIMEAAERLEERAHEIAAHGSPEPVQPAYAPQPIGGSMQPCGMHPSYGHVQPYGLDPYASYASGPAPLQQPYAPEPGYTPGPTLLQQPVQNQGGMSTGAKVAVGVGAAAVGVAGGVLIANHADEIGDAFGDVAGWVGNGVEDVGEFVEDMF